MENTKTILAMLSYSVAIVDVHTHIFPPEIIAEREKIAQRERGFSLLYGDGRAKMVDAAELLRYMETEGVQKAFVMSFPFEDQGLLRVTNDYILETSKRIPVVPFILVDLWDEDFSFSELERCFSLGARGIGEFATYDRSLGMDELKMLDPLAEFLQERRGILFLHVNEPVGHNYPGKTTVEVRALIDFIERHKELQVILAHLGGGLCFFEFMPEVRESLRNVYYDLAATPFLYDERVYLFVEAFLSEKVLFGSDFPLLPYGRYAKGLDRMTPENREKVLSRNAERVLHDRLG